MCTDKDDFCDHGKGRICLVYAYLYTGLPVRKEADKKYPAANGQVSVHGVATPAAITRTPLIRRFFFGLAKNIPRLRLT